MFSGILVTFSSPAPEPAPPDSDWPSSFKLDRSDPTPVTILSGDSYAAICYGEILSYGSDGSTTECVQQVLEDWKTGRLDYKALNGRFLLLIWDKPQQTWQIITDRMGAMHGYVRRSGNQIAEFSTDLAGLARQSPRDLDWDGLTSFLLFGFFLGDRTYFEDIKILRPASVYHIQNDGILLSHEEYFAWHHTVNHIRSFEQTRDEYHTLLDQALRRCTAHTRYMLPLSGGLDSRSLASLLPPAPETQTYSYGYTPDSPEIAIAANIANTRRFTFTPHVIQPYLFDNLEDITLALHGSQDVTMARQISVRDWLAAQSDVVLTGLWGDVWCDQMGLAEGLSASYDLTTYTHKKFLRRGSDWLLNHVIAPQRDPAQAESTLHEQLEQAYSGVADIIDLDFRLKALKNSHWAFRWSNASLRGFQLGATPRIPYYDVDLIDFFCTVPTEFVRDRRLQIEHLKRYAPDLARIRWQKAEANLYWARYGYWISLPRRAAKRAWNWLYKQQPIQRNWEKQFLSKNGFAQLQSQLLEPGIKLHNFVTPRDLQMLLTEIRTRPSAANGYTVSMLLTISSWFKSTL